MGGGASKPEDPAPAKEEKTNRHEKGRQREPSQRRREPSGENNDGVKKKKRKKKRKPEGEGASASASAAEGDTGKEKAGASPGEKRARATEIRGDASGSGLNGTANSEQGRESSNKDKNATNGGGKPVNTHEKEGEAAPAADHVTEVQEVSIEQGAKTKKAPPKAISPKAGSPKAGSPKAGSPKASTKASPTTSRKTSPAVSPKGSKKGKRPVATGVQSSTEQNGKGDRRNKEGKGGRPVSGGHEDRKAAGNGHNPASKPRKSPHKPASTPNAMEKKEEAKKSMELRKAYSQKVSSTQKLRTTPFSAEEDWNEEKRHDTPRTLTGLVPAIDQYGNRIKPKPMDYEVEGSIYFGDAKDAWWLQDTNEGAYAKPTKSPLRSQDPTGNGPTPRAKRVDDDEHAALINSLNGGRA